MVFSLIRMHSLVLCQEILITGLYIEVSTFAAGRAVMPSETSTLVTYYYFSDYFMINYHRLRGLGLYEF
jgi:hypothetical protein